MEVLKRENMLTLWFVWHFYEVPRFLFLIWKNYISFSSDFFSVTLLIKTLFSPWRRYNWKYPRGFDAGAFFNTLISNIFSRIIGLIVRIVLIILGAVAQIAVIMIGGIMILLWILMPLIFLVLVLFLFNS